MEVGCVFILFDTNVWFSQLGLQTHHGAAVRFFARQRDAIVAIPEIVELELEERLTAHLLSLRKNIEDSHRKLLPVLGKLQPLRIPSEDEVRRAVESIIPDFDIPVRRIPFNLEAARLSMMKLLSKIAPSAHSEQFRDGVIWAHCLELLEEGDVYLVSEDKAFYQERDYKKGLAKELAQEVAQVSATRKVQLKKDLSQLLDEIRMPIQLDNADLFESILQKKEMIEDLLVSNGFDLCGRVEGEAKCFATEEAERVYMSFDLDHPCQDSTGAGRRPGELKLEGSGFLDPITKETSGVRLSRIRLEYPDWEPGDPPRGTVFVSAHVNAPEVHQIRFPLESQ